MPESVQLTKEEQSLVIGAMLWETDRTKVRLERLTGLGDEHREERQHLMIRLNALDVIREKLVAMFDPPKSAELKEARGDRHDK